MLPRSPEEHSKFLHTHPRARARFLTGNSDVLTDLKAYDECVTLQADGKSQHAIRAFCEEVASQPLLLAEQPSQH